MIQKQFTRRGVLGLAATGGLVSACSGSGGNDESGEKAPAAPAERKTPGSFQESPSVSKQVQAGKLPPVKKRLPEKPYVVRQGDFVTKDFIAMKTGTYGGTLQMPQDAPTGDPHLFLGVHEPLIWASNGFDFADGFEGNVLEGMEASKNNTVFTCRLRQGLKWSDGEPVTMDDVKFAINDVLHNEQITPDFPAYLRSLSSPNEKPAQLKVVDDWTFQLIFDQPYGAFLALLAIGGWRTYRDVIKPKHYLKQFHKKYASKEKLSEEMKKNSVPEGQWFNLFNDKQFVSLTAMTGSAALGHPTLNPWVLTSADHGVFRYDRNPYYFKVDTEGNQLPYMDDIRAQVVQDKETLTSRALFGEFDYLGSRASMRKLPTFADKARAGKVKLFFILKHTLQTTFTLNLTYEDEVWRKVVRDVRFRQALSYALDRKEIIDTFYLGKFGQLPKLINPAEHNPKKANQLLDEMGMDKRDSGGWRLGPDGKRFRIPLDVQDFQADWIPMSELYAEQWKKVGVFTTTKQIDGTVATDRAQNNQIQAGGKNLSYPIWDSAVWTDYMPGDDYGPLWQTWYDSQGKDGEEPPDDVKLVFDEHEKMVAATPGSAKAKAAHDKIVKLHHDNLWYFCPVERHYAPTFWTPHVENVPKGGFNQKLFTKDETFGLLGIMSLEQWYLKGGK